MKKFGSKEMKRGREREGRKRTEMNWQGRGREGRREGKKEGREGERQGKGKQARDGKNRAEGKKRENMQERFLNEFGNMEKKWHKLNTPLKERERDEGAGDRK